MGRTGNASHASAHNGHTTKGPNAADSTSYNEYYLSYLLVDRNGPGLAVTHGSIGPWPRAAPD